MPGTLTLRDLLAELTRRRGSDLILKQERPPLFRVSGSVLPSEHPPLDKETLWQLLCEVLEESYVKRLEEDREVDFGFQHDDIGRFRANVFYQRSRVGCVIRSIPLEVPTIDEIGLPPVLKDLASAPNGIVLVTGPTGSGKSTTLAAVVEHINRTRAAHVITLEDPIEFVYSDKKSTITQRALGRDSLTIERALRAALRQAPDVILAGEMRDRATMELALHAAETGHMVLSTLHTNDAKQSIDRILDAFPPDARTGLLRMLSVTLRGIVCQRLIPRTDGAGRVAALEIMINSPTIKQLIEKGQIGDMAKAIEQSQSYYRMQSFNQSLAELVKRRLISEDDAMANTTSPGDLKLMLKGMVRSSGTGMHTRAELDDVRGEGGGSPPAPNDPTGAKTEAPAPAATPKSGIIPAPPALRRPAAGPGGPAPGGIRAPLRATGRPAPTGPAPGQAPAQQQPPAQEGEGGSRPKIQRGFDFR